MTISHFTGRNNQSDSHTSTSVMQSFVIEPLHKKTNNSGTDQVLHKPACTVTEDG